MIKWFVIVGVVEKSRVPMMSLVWDILNLKCDLMFKTGCGGTIILVGLVFRREVQVGEKGGLGDIDMVEHTQAEQAE